ncbi:sensor histidine kinase [Flavobacterium caeni]|uniref:histidine kinase n=1 Tax=Flavobacterium caeni TaxID=490189 RepID=A0A1G5EG99_9FLAO|nr:ATP-binding protein [Flavobacterium caeni]SCY25781.1 Histidine kinase-, DNA gyrase B-, and HSP90-like ATPase [Flavobacterium caeni]
MSRWMLLAIVFCCGLLAAQNRDVNRQIAVFNRCATLECQLSEAVKIAETYIETDHQDKAQQWIDYAKKINQLHPSDSISYFLTSLQTEAFYYMELFPFAIHEAEKGIEIGKTLKDSAFLADAYFFKGINEIETAELQSAEQALWLAKNYYPKRVGKHLRTLIGKAYVYNNLAQLKLKNKEIDSALYYNKKAYALAKTNSNFRGVVNGEQTFGLLYAEKKQIDSARWYLEKSIASAEKYGMRDIVALNCAYLMHWYTNDAQKVNALYVKGLAIIENSEVNNSYQRYFYVTALEVFQQMGDTKQILALQQKIISISEDTNDRARHFTQKITDQYVKNENKLLVAKINELNQSRNIAILQLVVALFGFLVLLFVALFFRRKNKLQQLLLDQKNEISKDLHDDIGSELGSILINANLLAKTQPSDKQQFLIGKINHTGTEISQRLNAFIWSLNTEHNTVRDFCEYAKRYSQNLFEGSDVVFHYSEKVADVDQKILNGYLRKNLFFCIKEALNNAVKHARATRIELSVSATEKHLTVVVRDNGIGLQQPHGMGNGLQNIRKRMQAVRGSVQLESHQGLQITLTIALAT